MSNHDEFLRGFSAGSGLEGDEAARAYAAWLDQEGYQEIYRIDLEAGGYEAGYEVGEAWQATN